VLYDTDIRHMLNSIEGAKVSGGALSKGYGHTMRFTRPDVRAGEAILIKRTLG